VGGRLVTFEDRLWDELASEAPCVFEHKSGEHVPPDVADRQAATYAHMLGLCVLCKRLPREHGELCEPCWEAGMDWARDEERAG
jgi:hypothetical protein